MEIFQEDAMLEEQVDKARQLFEEGYDRMYIISDEHFFHDQRFIWEERGYNSVEEMDAAHLQMFQDIEVERISSGAEEPTIFVHLGDVFLGRREKLYDIVPQIPGIHLFMRGNHMGAAKRDVLIELGWIYMGEELVIPCEERSQVKLWFTHWPKLANAHSRRLNIHGHTHSSDKISSKYSYNVSVDAILRPLPLRQVVKELIGFAEKGIVPRKEER